VLLAGGVLIPGDGSPAIGAIAAAGDSPDNDERIVQAAIDAQNK
jgi:uncharacterized protein GlcG (DUF336 family)